jgi:hypothetical protein
MHTLVPCPACGVAAEIEYRFFLPSTDGPIEHVVVNCAAGHHFRMSAAGLLGQPPPRHRRAPSLVPDLLPGIGPRPL